MTLRQFITKIVDFGDLDKELTVKINTRNENGSVVSFKEVRINFIYGLSNQIGVEQEDIDRARPEVDR